jgi:hypothetical protein
MSQPERIGALIEQLMRRRPFAMRKKTHDAGSVLAAVLGPTAAQVRVLGLRGGTLRLGVASAALREELAVYRSSEVLAALNDKLPDLRVRGIRFEMV